MIASRGKPKSKIISIVGARPQFVKLAGLVPVLAKQFHHTIIHTGQHYDDNMSRLFFRQLGLPRVSDNLGVGGCSQAAMTGRMITKLEPLLKKYNPDMVLVYGDTNSTLAGALTANKMNLPVAHIEAGMWSWVVDMPEEINRRLTDQISSILFCSNRQASVNLKNEKIIADRVVCGDLMYELLADKKSAIAKANSLVKKLGLKPNKYLYLTVHRANTLESATRLKQLFEILKSIDEPILWPIHPHTLVILKKMKLYSQFTKLKNLILSQPLGYFENLNAVKNARIVLTDSGGLQKESLFVGTPVLTLRAETEWNDTLKLGNRLVDLDFDLIKKGIARPPKVKPIDFRIKSKRPSKIIADQIRKYMCNI